MARILLIRHAEPEVDPDLPATEWPLSPAGEQASRRVGHYLTDRGIGRMFSSHEQKAIRTAEIVAECLGLENQIAPGLHEHDRTGVGYLESDAFQSAIRDLFARPSETVFGRESADAAVGRFSDALSKIEADIPIDTSIACASHGTILSLFAATLGNVDGHTLWQQLGMPATIEIDRQTRAIIDIRLSY